MTVNSRILVIEDEAAVARGLQYALREEGYSVSVASSGQDGITKAREEDPDLIILDIRLPDMSGFDVCRELRKEMKQPILILTVRDEEADKILGLELGADDYLTKPFSLRELLSRVRALLRRAYGPLATRGVGPRITLGRLTIDLEKQHVYRGEEVVDLTATEFRLLRYLATHPGRIFTRAQLIDAVWGYREFFGDERTVDVHIHRLRQKIEDDPGNPKHILTVRGLGYEFQE